MELEHEFDDSDDEQFDAATIFVASLAEILHPPSSLEDMSREQLISKVRDLQAELSTATDSRAPQPKPKPSRLMRSAKADRAALSVGAEGHVEAARELPDAGLLDVGSSTPSAQAHLSDAALLQALFPADDVPPESREDFHQTLHSDPEMAQDLLQNVRQLLYQNFGNNEKMDLEHEVDDSDDEQLDDEDFDDEGQTEEEDDG